MDRGLPGSDDSWTVITFIAVKSHHSPGASWWTTYDPWLISGRGSPAQEGLRTDCWHKNRNTTDCVENKTDFSLKELDSVSLNIFSTNNCYWCSAPPTEVRADCELQLWVKGQVQKHVCGSETKLLSGPFKALRNPRKSEVSGWFLNANGWRKSL